MATKSVPPKTTLKTVVQKYGLHETVAMLIEAACDQDNPAGLITGRELTDLTLTLLVDTSNQGTLLGIELASNEESGWERLGLKDKEERTRLQMLALELLNYAIPATPRRSRRKQNLGPVEGVPLEDLPIVLNPHEEEELLEVMSGLTSEPGPGEDTFLRNTTMEADFIAITQGGE